MSLVLREFRINSDYLDDEGFNDVEINSNDDSMEMSFAKLMIFSEFGIFMSSEQVNRDRNNCDTHYSRF